MAGRALLSAIAGRTASMCCLSCAREDHARCKQGNLHKENVAVKALADQSSDLFFPTQSDFRRLLGRIEEDKGEAYATKIDVRCSERNRIVSTKRILIATGGSATAEMAMRYSCFGQWLSRVWMAFMDESQQYGNYQEIAALAAIQQPALIVFLGDHRQTLGPIKRETCGCQPTDSCIDHWTSEHLGSLETTSPSQTQ